MEKNHLINYRFFLKTKNFEKRKFEINPKNIPNRLAKKIVSSSIMKIFIVMKFELMNILLNNSAVKY